MPKLNIPAIKRVSCDDPCPHEGCSGSMVYSPEGDCSCHIIAPCHVCSEAPLICTSCGYQQDIFPQKKPLTREDFIPKQEPWPDSERIALKNAMTLIALSEALLSNDRILIDNERKLITVKRDYRQEEVHFDGTMEGLLYAIQKAIPHDKLIKSTKYAYNLNWKPWPEGRKIPDEIPVDELLLVRVDGHRKYVSAVFWLNDSNQKMGVVGDAFWFDRKIIEWCSIQHLVPEKPR